MPKFVIQGGKKLTGEVRIGGNKNSALKLMAAALMVEGETTLRNVPRIRDIQVMGEILQSLGVKVEGLGSGKVKIDPSNLRDWKIPKELGSRIRGAVVLAAPLLARFSKVSLPLPGGDSIGERALETHFSMLENFGAKIKERDSVFDINLPKTPPKLEIFLEEASVTATEMALMIASGFKTQVTILDAACEPHIADLAGFLKKSGAKIEGEGTQKIVVKGRRHLSAAEYKIRPDHIEAGTFAIAAAITGGQVRIKEALQEDFPMIGLYLQKMGVKQRFINKKILEISPSNLIARKKKFHTRPWPGFPTDLMSPFIVLATQTKGTVLCHDWMYEWRVFFVDHLISMGANITIADPHRVLVTGPTKLHGEQIPSPDIRAGGALLLAALVAKGESIIEHAEVIERGYERIEEKLAGVGARIKKV